MTTGSSAPSLGMYAYAQEQLEVRIFGFMRADMTFSDSCIYSLLGAPAYSILSRSTPHLDKLLSRIYILDCSTLSLM